MIRLAVDAWAPGMGTALRSDDDLQPARGPVNVNPEVPAADWAPRTPPSAITPAPDVRFVDGVRRIDARIWAFDDDADSPTRAALAASYAAGTVRSNGQATVEDCEVRRMIFGPADVPALGAGSLTYRPAAVASDDDDALDAAIQERMRQLEIEIVSRAPAAPLTVIDGPLSGRQHVPGAVGYVKTHRIAYLPAGVDAVVAALAPAQRTPLFLTQTSYNRYSWYLRLPHGQGHPWAGIVRLEASADLPLDRAVELADLTAVTLPRFASRPHRDPRAPQNLYPIAGLEQALKRRLGDRAYLERRLRQAASDLRSASSPAG